MIFTVILFIVSLPLYVFSFIGSGLASIFPSWLTDTINNVVGGSGFLNSVFPMFPHPGMPGLAGQIGIMTIFGWAIVLMGYLILISLGFKLAKIVLNAFSIGAGPSIGTGGR